MINEENLKKIYGSNQELTTKVLTGYGFNSKDLSKLVETGILERIKRGHYSLSKSSIVGKIFFSKPIIEKGDNSETFNHKNFLSFFEALNKKDFNKARSYLDKIYQSNDLDKIERLKQILNNTEMMLNDNQNSQNPSVDTKTPTQKDTSKLFTQQRKQSTSDFKTVQTKKKTYDANELISQKLEELYQKGMLLLKPMDNERIKEIEEIVENIPDVSAFSIPSGSSKQIVLRYKPDILEPLNIKELFAVGNEAYKNGDYDTCISEYRKLLAIGHPKSFVYGKLGFAYMKKNNIKDAIDYLTVATELNKNENGNYDYTELINKLNGTTAEEDRKTYVRMSTADFKNDLDNYYGIEQVEQIAELISYGATFDEACLNMHIDEEQKNTIALIFAREYYAEENYKMGDQYLKRVERTKNKSAFIKSLIEELRKNKKFYKNRIEKRQKQLVLTSKKSSLK